MRRQGHSGKSVQFVWTIFLVALGLRVSFVLFYPQMPVANDDSVLYDRFGWNLATGKGFVGRFAELTVDSPDAPEVLVGPMYPAFLALIYLTFGHQLIAVRIVQAFLSAAAILVLYPKVREAFGSEIGKLSGVLIAIYPPFIIYPGVLMTETVFLFFLTILVWVLIHAVQSDSAWRWALAGCVMGVTILLRQEALAMVPIYGGLILWQFPQRELIRKLSIFLLVTALTVGVWTVRNYLVFQEFILVSPPRGEVLWFSATGRTELRDDDEELQSLVQGLNGIERNKVLNREGMRNILHDPLRYFLFCIKRLPQFWISSSTTYLVGFTDTYKQYYMHGAFGKLFVKIVLLGVNVGLIFLWAWGAFIALKAQKERVGLILFFLVPIGVIAIIHFFLFATDRYKVPIMPFILIFSAIALERLDLRKKFPFFHHS